MDNLLTNWVKPGLVNEGVYRYPHRATMCANWICLDDVAQLLSQALGKPIRYEYVTPR